MTCLLLKDLFCFLSMNEYVKLLKSEVLGVKQKYMVLWGRIIIGRCFRFLFRIFGTRGGKVQFQHVKYLFPHRIVASSFSSQKRGGGTIGLRPEIKADRLVKILKRELVVKQTNFLIVDMTGYQTHRHALTIGFLQYINNILMVSILHIQSLVSVFFGLQI